MEKSQVDANRVLNVWSWCSEAYLRQGRKLSLPTGTDPAKTYQWRYAAAITKKFEEWGLTDEAAKKFIEIAVQIAKEQGTLKKGLAVLHQANMLSLCYDKLQTESVNNTQSLESLRFVHNWFLKKIGMADPLATLLTRVPRSYCNLTLWAQASRLSSLYLALYRPCTQALASLDHYFPDERAILPKATHLYLIREEFSKDRGNLQQAREILAQDWRIPCLSAS